ncbi:ATP-binding protein [Chitinilyticum litopenaei]|uniref:ATP-binding protein n=1 Tax=Chitinilyticum litopenaei TaxID=1121276 RepID=UPI0003F80F57|nr:ATP-binding protein [Chitinilyticum litopenaei]
MRFSLRAAIILAVLFGLLLPASINGYFGIRSEQQDMQRSFAHEQQRLAEILALGMREPIWNLTPEAGRPLLESVLGDERVVRITVVDAAQGQPFLSANFPERRRSRLSIVSLPVNKEGRQIGVINLEMDNGQAEETLRNKQNQYLIAVAVQAIISISLIYVLLNARLLRPLQRLLRQSSRLAKRDLDETFVWDRADELGELGKSLERTRQSLKELVVDLEQKNLQLEADLISRGQAEAALRASEQRLRRLVENSSVIPWDARPGEWRFTYIGPQAEMLLGLPLSVWYEDSFLTQVIHPDDQYLIYQLFGEHSEQQGQRHFECRMRRADGSDAWILLLANTSNSEGSRFLHGYLVDISERKQNEIELDLYRHHLEDAVESRTQALAAAQRENEELGNAISNDLRGPLRLLEGLSDILDKDYARMLDDSGRAYLRQLAAGLQNLHNHLDDLLTLQQFARAEPELQDVDLSALASELLEEIAILQPDRAIELDITPGLLARADPQLIRIALHNLLDNAWKYTQDSPAPRIRFAASQHNGKTVYCVSDNGCGFDMTHASKLFAPFQRPHGGASQGSNSIGLAIVQRIIARHHGKVWAKATPGAGASFCFTLA